MFKNPKPNTTSSRFYQCKLFHKTVKKLYFHNKTEDSFTKNNFLTFCRSRLLYPVKFITPLPSDTLFPIRFSFVVEGGSNCQQD